MQKTTRNKYSEKHVQDTNILDIASRNMMKSGLNNMKKTDRTNLTRIKSADMMKTAKM